MRLTIPYLTLLVLSTLLSTACSHETRAEVPVRRPESVLNDLPLHFEPRPGLPGRGPEYLARAAGGAVALAGGEVRVAPGGGTGEVMTISFPGAHGPERVEAEERLPGVSNYILGSEASRWRTGVPRYGQVRWRDLYRGVDVLFYGRSGMFEYDFMVAPGADVSGIALRYEGAIPVEVDSGGNLVLRGKEGDVLQLKPHSYQDIGGTRVPVMSEYVLGDDGRVGFQVGDYDAEHRLVIDPVLDFTATFGGNGPDVANAIVVDSAGNTYLTGYTASSDLAASWGSPQRELAGNRDVFVAKMSADGSTLSYLTYLGGPDADRANAIALDDSGSVHIAGFASSGFPVTAGAFEVKCCGAFVAKLAPQGDDLSYSTFLGSGEVYGMVVDAAGSAHVTGLAYASFPVSDGSYQSSFGGGTDAFAAKLDPTGGSLVYSTFLGGANYDRAYGIALNPAGEAIVAGYTHSVDFPLPAGAFQTIHGGGSDAFAARISATGEDLLYSTLLGGSSRDEAHAIAVDSFGDAYVAGMTSSPDYPVTAGAYRTAADPGQNSGFVTKLDVDGAGLGYSTLLGPVTDYYTTRFGLAVDGGGLASVTGTASGGFPTSPDAFQAFPGGGADAFVLQLNAGGSGALYSSYIGGSGDDYGRAIALDSYGGVYVAGATLSSDFPVAGAGTHRLREGEIDVFAVRVGSDATPCSYAFFPSSRGFPAGGGLGSIGVTAPSGCVWSAGPDASWVDVSSPGSGQGNGVIDYSVAANPGGGARMAQVEIAGRVFKVHQSGTAAPAPPSGPSAVVAGQACQYASGGIDFVDEGLVEYRFDWGNGTQSSWGGHTGAFAWPEQGMYFVSAQARSSLHPQMVTDWSSPTAVSVHAPAEMLSNELFAQQTYEDILNRSIDGAALAASVAALNAGALTRAHYVTNLIGSAEYASRGAFVVRCYLAVMRRSPDFGGWINWQDAMLAGWSQTMVVDAFVEAPEFTLLYGELTDAQYVTLVYQNVLGRDPDPAGFDNWLGQLQSGDLTRAEMMMGFILSPEYIGKTAVQVQVETAYLALLRRASDPGRAANWMGFFEAHPLHEGIGYFISSQEYLLRFR